MISTTPEYKIAIKSTNRKMFGKIEITWTDPFIDHTIVVTANEKNRALVENTYLLPQVTDLLTAPLYRWAHLDQTILANGNYHPMPGTQALSVRGQLGYWSGANGDGSGNYAINPLITVTFTARATSSLLVCGDSIYGEYPTSFEVSVFTLSTDVVPIYTDSVTNGVGVGWDRSKVSPSDSVAVRWYKEIPYISSCEKMTLEIIKWSTPSRVVKITEFYTSIVETYTDDDILSFQITEETEVNNASTPLGNISANEINLKLQNVTDIFFPANNFSPLYRMIKPGRKIRAWIGIELPNATIEYIPMGVFWSGDWDATEQSTSVSTTGRDRMEHLRTAFFDVSLIYENYNLYDILVIILEDAIIKFPDLEYYIDTGYQSISIRYVWFDKTSYFDCINMIIQAASGYSYVDRYGVLQILI